MSKIKKDDVLIFKGYEDDSAEKILQTGHRVRVVSVDKDGGIGCMPIVEEGAEALPGDTAYPEELCTVAEWQAIVDGEAAENQAQLDPGAAEDAEAAAAPDTGKGKAKETAKSVVKKISAKKSAAKEAADDKEAAAAPAAPVALEVAKASKKKVKAAAEAAPAQATLPVVTEEPEVLEVTHASSVSALLSEMDALDAAKELVRRADENEFTLGGILAHIQREGIHQRLGFDGKRGFEDYIEKELGVKYRKARYLITIHETLTAKGIDESRIQSIGWSKLKEICGVATNEDFDEYVEFAKEHTRDELIAYREAKLVNADATEAGEKAKLVSWRFSLFQDQSETVGKAIAVAKTQAGTEDQNAALEHICAEWSMMADNKLSLDEMLAMVESRFKVKINVDRTTDEGQTDIESEPVDEMQAA